MSAWSTGRWTDGPFEPSEPVTCAVCGCRLAEAPGLEGTAWLHFQLTPGSDARGCRPFCLDELHRDDGTVLVVQSLETLMAAEGGAPAA